MALHDLYLDVLSATGGTLLSSLSNVTFESNAADFASALLVTGRTATTATSSQLWAASIQGSTFIGNRAGDNTTVVATGPVAWQLDAPHREIRGRLYGVLRTVLERDRRNEARPHQLRLRRPLPRRPLLREGHSRAEALPGGEIHSEPRCNQPGCVHQM